MTKEEFINESGKYYSRQEMADALNVSLSTIKRYLSKFDLKSKDCFKQKEKKIKAESSHTGIFGNIRTFKSEYLEEFLKLYNEGKNDSEIAQALQVNHVTIHNWRVAKNLPANFKYIKKFDTNKFIELYNEGLCYVEIAKELGVSSSAINDYALSLGLKPNKSVIEDMNNEEFQVFLGNILGDGYLKEDGGGNFAHSLKQSEYFYWKYNKLRRLCNTPKFKEEYDTRTNKYYACLYSNIKSCLTINKYYYKFYNNKIKYIDKELLYRIDGLGIAVWFMDDGYYDHQSIAIATNCFSDSDLNTIIEMFQEKFNLHFNIESDKSIRLIKSDLEKFKNLVLEYIHPTLLYKIGSH